jgi:signal transduction histidine kinase
MKMLRVLIVEDSADEAELVLRELRRGGYSITHQRVQTEDAMRRALLEPFDLVLTDFQMPDFDGERAVAVVNEIGLDVPVIMVSGRIGEETAVTALQAGACDFILKGKMARLVPAVDRALRQLEERVARREAERLSKRKSAFLADVSHELRTPLNAIIGFAELLVTRQVPRDSPQGDEFLDDILKSGQHLLRLINDVLDLSKVEAGRLEFEPELSDWATLAHDVLSIVGGGARTRGIEIVLEEGAGQLFVDPLRLKQVLFNFISNAIKFTPPGGRIVVRAHAEADASVRVEVEDNGAGMAASDMARLFVDYEQVSNDSAKRREGTGLGLALTKRIVEAQGGCVGVTSQLGRGSTFFATFPNAVPASNPSGGNLTSIPRLRSPSSS